MKIKIPDSFSLGGVEVEVEALSRSELQDEEECSFCEEYLEGYYENDPPKIAYDNGLSDQRQLNVVTHELSHAICDLIFSLKYDLNEIETQSLGNALHQIILRFVAVNKDDE